MPEWLPSIPYPPPGQHGYWEPVTSTIDWCEENYYATKWSAEIVNTLTNLLFMGFAINGAVNCIQQGHDTIFLVSFIGYGLVGTASFLFHATLKYPWQLADEMSMIVITLIMCYATFSHSRGWLFSTALAISLIALALFIGVYYHYLQDPTFHQTAYAILTTIVLLRSMWIMETSLRPALVAREKARALQNGLVFSNGGADANGYANGHANGSAIGNAIGNANGHANGHAKGHKKRGSIDRFVFGDIAEEADRKIIRTMWQMVGYGLGIFLGGFAIWNLDNEYCGTIRSWRHDVGLPWGVVLEGHGWWHIMTGTGAYYYIVWGVWLRHCLNGREREYELRWKHLWSLPAVVRVQPSANGSAKKIQ